jgi:hypothetical protein
LRNETALVPAIRNCCSSDERELRLIPRLVSELALGVVIVCCKLFVRLSPSPAQVEQSVGDCPDDGRIAVALVDYQLSCRCKSCLSELIVTGLRVEHLYRNPPCDDVDPEKWRWSMAVCEPFTTIEAALLDTNDELIIKLAYPALASLIEKELRARYEEDFESSHEVQERSRGLFCVAATHH